MYDTTQINKVSMTGTTKIQFFASKIQFEDCVYMPTEAILEMESKVQSWMDVNFSSNINNFNAGTWSVCDWSPWQACIEYPACGSVGFWGTWSVCDWSPWHACHSTPHTDRLGFGVPEASATGLPVDRLGFRIPEASTHGLPGKLALVLCILIGLILRYLRRLQLASLASLLQYSASQPVRFRGTQTLDLFYLSNIEFHFSCQGLFYANFLRWFQKRTPFLKIVICWAMNQILCQIELFSSFPQKYLTILMSLTLF